MLQVRRRIRKLGFSGVVHRIVVLCVGYSGSVKIAAAFVLLRGYLQDQKPDSPGHECIIVH